MKRSISLILLTLLTVLSICGCSSESKKPTEIIYTSDILINEEMPDKFLIWEAHIEAPAEGNTLLPIGAYSTYAHITSKGIEISNPRYGADMIEKTTSTVLVTMDPHTMLCYRKNKRATS